MLDGGLRFVNTLRNTKGCHRRNSNDTSKLLFLGYWNAVGYCDIIKWLWCERVGGEEPIQNFGKVHLEDQELDKEIERWDGCGWESGVEETTSKSCQVSCCSCYCSYVQYLTVIRISGIWYKLF